MQQGPMHRKALDDYSDGVTARNKDAGADTKGIFGFISGPRQVRKVADLTVLCRRQHSF
jgi:hypothetical protein